MMIMMLVVYSSHSVVERLFKVNYRWRKVEFINAKVGSSAPMSSYMGFVVTVVGLLLVFTLILVSFSHTY